MFILRIIFNNKLKEECVLTEYVKFEKENNDVFLVIYNEMEGENENDFTENVENIEYININHYSYYKMKDFYDAYKAISTSRRTYGSLVSVSDIQNKLISNQEEMIFNEVMTKMNSKENKKDIKNQSEEKTKSEKNEV